MITGSPSLTSTVSLVAQEQVNRGPQGPEFGKAAPVGLLVIVGLLVVILALGYLFNRRMRKMHKRRDFAEANGIDPFDIDTIDRRMAQEEAADVENTRRNAAERAGIDAHDGDDVRSTDGEDAGGDQR
ncbi:MAG: hypothetical protein L0K56_05365 [Corynebacterium sp.]|nr:hypothetical protein [Corynebacterium sp.]